MSQGLVLAITLVIGMGIALVLITAMTRAILTERRSARLPRIWANFGLSLSFLALFIVSWIGQAVAE